MHKFQVLMIHSEEHDLVINMIQLLILMIHVQVLIISIVVIYKLIKQDIISSLMKLNGVLKNNMFISIQSTLLITITSTMLINVHLTYHSMNKVLNQHNVLQNVELKYTIMI